MTRSLALAENQVTPTADFTLSSTSPARPVPPRPHLYLAAQGRILTQHVDKDAAGAYKNTGTIDTVLFVDGLKRVLQTKKDATVLEDGTSAALDKMIISGRVSFDAFGRTVQQFYPTTEPKHPSTPSTGQSGPRTNTTP